MNVEDNGQPVHSDESKNISADDKIQEDQVISDKGAALTALALGELEDPSERKQLEQLLNTDEAQRREYESTARLASMIKDAVENDLPLAPGSLHDVVLTELNNRSGSDGLDSGSPETTRILNASPQPKSDATTSGRYWFAQKPAFAIAVSACLLVVCAMIWRPWEERRGTPTNLAQAERNAAQGDDQSDSSRSLEDLEESRDSTLLDEVQLSLDPGQEKPDRYKVEFEDRSSVNRIEKKFGNSNGVIDSVQLNAAEVDSAVNKLGQEIQPRGLGRARLGDDRNYAAPSSGDGKPGKASEATGGISDNKMKFRYEDGNSNSEMNRNSELKRDQLKRSGSNSSGRAANRYSEKSKTAGGGFGIAGGSAPMVAGGEAKTEAPKAPVPKATAAESFGGMQGGGGRGFGGGGGVGGGGFGGAMSGNGGSGDRASGSAERPNVSNSASLGAGSGSGASPGGGRGREKSLDKFNLQGNRGGNAGPANEPDMKKGIAAPLGQNVGGKKLNKDASPLPSTKPSAKPSFGRGIPGYEQGGYEQGKPKSNSGIRLTGDEPRQMPTEKSESSKSLQIESLDVDKGGVEGKSKSIRQRKRLPEEDDKADPLGPADNSAKETAPESEDFGKPKPDSAVEPANDSLVEEVVRDEPLLVENEFVQPLGLDGLSTFSIDTDTAAYTYLRTNLNQNRLPKPEDVRIEEMLNYFSYDYPQPKAGERFSVNLELSSSPWSPGNKLLRVGLQAAEMKNASRPPSNLVFLVDVSGSMRAANKLPLLQKGLSAMVERLREDDFVSIVTYSNHVRVALEPTDGSQKEKIKKAIGSLVAKGGTNGSGGLQEAYTLARQHFLEGGTNRIVMGTDGDFNLGLKDDDELVAFIKKQSSEANVFLTICGFGIGNFKDGKVQKMAQNGNGKVYYIDTFEEAQRTLVEKIAGGLVNVAKDVKIQMLFNPAEVQAYRLIGYESRMLQASDFANDQKDAGEIEAGDSVTALYEIVPANAEHSFPTALKVQPIDLKYQKVEEKKYSLTQAAKSDEVATLRIRFKDPESSTSGKLEMPVKKNATSFNRSSKDMQFAATVAGFGMLLRKSKHRGTLNYEGLAELATGALHGEESKERLQLKELIEKAKSLNQR